MMGACLPQEEFRECDRNNHIVARGWHDQPIYWIRDKVECCKTWPLRLLSHGCSATWTPSSSIKGCLVRERVLPVWRGAPSLFYSSRWLAGVYVRLYIFSYKYDELLWSIPHKKYVFVYSSSILSWVTSQIASAMTKLRPLYYSYSLDQN